MGIKEYEYTDLPGWSYSRYRMLRECPRQYWYHYYGIKYGDKNISQEIRRLKKFTALPLEVGHVVHQTIAHSLRDIIMRGKTPSKDKLLLRAQNALRIYLGSKQFIEKELGHGFNDDKLKSAFERLRNALSVFISHPLLPEIIASLTERSTSCVIDPEGYGECRIDGKKVYAKPDLVYSDEKGKIKVIDWKTGSSDRGENVIQLGGYLFYAVDVLGHLIKNLEGRIIYLSPPQDDLILEPTEESMNVIKSRVLREIEEIEEYCSDIKNNIPKPMRLFPKTIESHFCLFCKYKHICDKYD